MRAILGRIADFIRETDKILLFLCLFASFYGSVLVLSATRYTGSSRQFWVQLASLLIGLTAAIVISLIDYETIARWWPAVAGACLAVFALTFFIGYAPNDAGSPSWIRLPIGMSFQPSELLKVAFIVTFSKHVSLLKGAPPRFVHVVLLCLHGAVPVGLIVVQGDDGSALIMLGIFAGMMVAANVKLRYFISAAAAATVAVPLMWFYKILKPHQIQRFTVLYGPDKDLAGVGYQQYHARIAFANGGFLGNGLFRGREVQGGILPKAYNDFIYAACGEELGYLGCIVILILLVAICLRLMRVAALSKDNLGRMICVGVFSMIAIQAIVNIGMCLSLLPVIGITLPFFTAGGSSLICIFMGIGLSVSVYSHRNKRILYLKDM